MKKFKNIRINLRRFYDNPFSFFILALSISWFFWFFIILFDLNTFKFPGIIFGALGLFGPAIAEIILIKLSDEKNKGKTYLQRLIDFRKIKLQYYLFIILFSPVINIISLFLSTLSGNKWPEFTKLTELIKHTSGIFPFLFFILLYGPLPEELGWRGYALLKLQKRFNALISSILLGAIWSLWHFPLFFMKGQWQHDVLRFGTFDFFIFILSPVILSIIFTWIFNNNKESTLSAILFHFMINLSGWLIPMDFKTRFYSFILTFISAIVIVLIYKPDKLMGEGKRV